MTKGARLRSSDCSLGDLRSLRFYGRFYLDPVQDEANSRGVES